MHDEMKKPDMSEICQIEKDLMSALKTVVSHGIFSKEVDTKDLGELVDMVKDMAEVKRNCWEAHYYKTVSEAMEEYDPEEEARMGYNTNRYASGRYAPAGTGNRAGFMPMYNNIPYMNRVDYDMKSMGYPMGYSGEGRMRDNGRLMGYSNAFPGRPYGYQYGDAYGDYEDARRHYTETKSLEDKRHMDEKAMEHVDQSMMTLREIWKNADPAIKKEVSASISSLASEFKTV